MDTQKTKKQHCVPQSYLRRFTHDNTSLCVFDKEAAKTYPAKVKDVAQERYFYDLPDHVKQHGIDVQSAEKMFSRREARFSALINSMLPHIESTVLSYKQKVELCPHVVMQWARTRECRDGILEILKKSGQAVVNRLIELNYPPSYRHLTPGFVIPDEAEAAWHFAYIFDPRLNQEIMQTLMNHIWFIGVNPHSQPLYTSDNPVVRQAHNDIPFLGGAGAGALGVEFVYPLTPKYALVLRDRTYFRHNELRENRAFKLELEEVERFNRLQVIQSSRQVYCADDQFDNARRFWTDNQDLMSRQRERFDVCINHKRISADGKEIVDELIVMQRLDRFR